MSGSPFDITATSKAVHATLDQALAAIPAGKSNALLIDGTFSKTDGPSFKGIVVHKVSETWAVALEGSYDGPHGVQGGVQVAGAW